MESKIYSITPVAKPRMTRSDKWKKRDCVMKYWAFCDEVRLKGVTLPESGSHIIFKIPMPDSWSKKKKMKMLGKPHQQVPDGDNFCKALFDAIFDDDSHIWDFRVTKRWHIEGGIEIYET